MMKRLLQTTAGALVLLMILGCGADRDRTVSSANKSFTFNGSMSKEVLRNYASRAVTSWIVLEGNTPDPIFEEDLRMHRRIGAKYIGRAASFSWSGNMNKSMVDEHFRLAKEIAAKVHAADPEMILQGGVFEIVYKQTVESTPIPAWVFQAFNQPVETRNFRYKDVAFPSGHKYGPGFWGTGLDGAVPKIANIEAQMYFYYNICRYIDAGFEAIHIGQSEMMMDYTNATNAVEWDRVLTLARTYAKTHARRGIVLFDAHSSLDSGGIRVGNRLILDIQGAALVPNETRKSNGALMCEILHFEDNWLSWVGRSAGGIHPLGFAVTQNFTILEFDNYGGNSNPGVPTFKQFYVWGYDDVTWYALQPEWYRNQFLEETDSFLRTDSRILDSQGQQIYFLQPVLRRVLTAQQKMTYKPGTHYNPDFVLDYFSAERTLYSYNADTREFALTIRKDYRANRQSDGCPNGSGQEDTIREIFLGKGVPENPELLKIVLPAGYDPVTPEPTQPASSSTTSSSSSVSTSPSSQPASSTPVSASGSNPDPSGTTSEDLTSDTSEESTDSGNPSSQDASGASTDGQDSGVSGTPDDNATRTPWGWIIGGVSAILAAGIATLLVRRRRKS